MTTIAAGASATVTIPQGSKLKTTGLGIAVRGPGSRANQSTALRDATSFGPYQHDQVIYLTATTAMTYLVEVNANSLPALRATVDADNNIDVLVGDSNFVNLTPRALPVFVFLGDSTFAYSHGLSSSATTLVSNGDGTATITFGSAQGIQVGDPIGVQVSNNEGFKVRESIVTAVNGNAYTYLLNPGASVPASDGATAAVIRYPLRASAAGPLTQLNNLTHKRFRFINSGQGGDTFTKILARFDVDAKPFMPDRIVFTTGINDIFGASRTLADLQADFVTLMAKCKAIGAKLDVVTPFPQMDTRNLWSGPKRDIFIAWRKYLIRTCADNGMLCFDWASLAAGSLQVQDSTSVNAIPSAGTYNPVDKIHAMTNAVYVLVKDMARVYNPIYQTGASSGTPRNTTDGGLFSNPLFTGTGGTATNGTGTVSGTIATNVTVTVSAGTGVATASLTPRTIAADGDQAGNWQVVSFAAAALGDQCQIKLQNIASQLVNGDKVRVQGLVRITAGVALCRELSLLANSQTATTGNLLITDMQAAYSTTTALTSQAAPYPENFTMTYGFDGIVRGPLSVHGAPTNFVPTIQFNAAAAGTMQVEIACWSAEKL